MYITNQVLYIRQMPENKREYSGAVHYYSAMRKVLCDIFIQWCIPLNIGSEIEMCLNESSSKVRLGRYLSDTVPVQNALQHCDTLLPLLSSFDLQDAIQKVSSFHQSCEKVH